MLQIKQSIFKLESSSQDVYHPSQVLETSVTSLPSTNEGTTDASKPPADTDESFVSIEEFIPDEELAGTSHYLNSNHPTLLSTPSPSAL